MKNTDSDSDRSFRAELAALIGMRWDSVISWGVVCMLSVWFWRVHHLALLEGVDAFNSSVLVGESQWFGPFTGVRLFLEHLDLGLPSWFEQILDILHDPSFSWVVQASILTCTFSAVNSIQHERSTGLEILALVSISIAIEAKGNLEPVLWVLGLSAVPTLIAIGIAVWQSRRPLEDANGGRYYIKQIVACYIVDVWGIFGRVLLVPVIALLALVKSYRFRPQYQPGPEVARKAIRRLEECVESSRDPDHLTQSAIYAAIKLAGNKSHEAQRILASYDYYLQHRQERETLEIDSRRQLIKMASTPPIDMKTATDRGLFGGTSLDYASKDKTSEDL